MRAYLVRIAVDQAYGQWNGPMDPATNEFVYVPIPESRPMHPTLATPYTGVAPALAAFAARHLDARRADVCLSHELAAQSLSGLLGIDVRITWSDKLWAMLGRLIVLVRVVRAIFHYLRDLFQ